MAVNDPSGRREKKEYILVSSDNRSADSVSTTDFTLRLAVPINDVVKTDLVQVAMDYNVANIKAPNNTFTIGVGDVSGDSTVLNTIFLEEGLYTLDVLAGWIQEQLEEPYNVFYSVSGALMIQLELTNQASQNDTPANRMLTCNVDVANILGLNVASNATIAITPSFNAVDGKFGTYQWTFPRPVQLGGIYPYLFIQSRELGTDIKVANGAMGFWRMVLNDQVNYSLTMVNNRVDTYTDVPRKLQNIDIKLVYPDGTDVNNNGGRFTLLLEIVRLV